MYLGFGSQPVSFCFARSKILKSCCRQMALKFLLGWILWTKTLNGCCERWHWFWLILLRESRLHSSFCYARNSISTCNLRQNSATCYFGMCVCGRLFLWFVVKYNICCKGMSGCWDLIGSLCKVKTRELWTT